MTNHRKTNPESAAKAGLAYYKKLETVIPQIRMRTDDERYDQLSADHETVKAVHGESKAAVIEAVRRYARVIRNRNK